MAKSKNHTAHNQSHKAHRNGIKKPKRNRNNSIVEAGKKLKDLKAQSLSGAQKVFEEMSEPLVVTFPSTAHQLAAWPPPQQPPGKKSKTGKVRLDDTDSTAAGPSSRVQIAGVFAGERFVPGGDRQLLRLNINTFYSEVQNIHLEDPLPLPSALKSSFNVVDGPLSSAAGDPDEIAKLFLGLFGHLSASLVPGTGNLSGQCLKIGVVLSGGQAPREHNVISGIFDYLQDRCKRSTL